MQVDQVDELERQNRRDYRGNAETDKAKLNIVSMS